MVATRTRRSARPRQDVYEIVTEQVIAALESGTVPWHRSWRVFDGLPKSMSTGKAYRGINVLLLSMAQSAGGYESPWWGTYNKIAERGGQVRKGEKSTMVTFWKFYDAPAKDDADGGDEDGEHSSHRFVLRYYRVFNAEQADWPEGKAPVFERVELTEIERSEAAEKIMANYPNGPLVRYVVQSQAYYEPLADRVTLPKREQFESADEFYSTAFHELTHSTGHKSRLNREGIQKGTFGSEVYSKEELVAEFGAAMLTAVAGISRDTTLANSAAYIKHWLGHLREEPKLVVQAAAQAQHAADHILGVHFEPKEAS